MFLAAGSKEWSVPTAAPGPDFKSKTEQWLILFDQSVKSIDVEILTERVRHAWKYSEKPQDPWVPINDQLSLVKDLEAKLKSLEWIAQCVWHDAGKLGDFDFDQLYQMVDPSDEVSIKDSPPNKPLRPMLDGLISESIEVNKIQSKLCLLLDTPIYQEPSITAPIVRLERSVWAVVIGIDDYSSAPLRCAVADAEAMSKFLTEKLDVPDGHITKLLAPDKGNRESPTFPSRKNILCELWSLHKNENIKRGDTVIVFYSGHGAVYSSGGVLRRGGGGAERSKEGEDWNTFYERNRIDFAKLEEVPSGPFIDAIIPADHGEKEEDLAYAGDGVKVPDISDRELNTIFRVTGLTKGTDIIFIADCCYAASVARDFQDVTKWRVRSLPPLLREDMEQMLLRAEWNVKKFVAPDLRNNLPSVLDLHWSPDLSSFVTLAACRRDQTAKEHFNQGNGLFTGVLLDTLESNLVDATTTFEQLIEVVDEKLRKWQEPIVVGAKKGSRLWFRDN